MEKIRKWVDPQVKGRNERRNEGFRRGESILLKTPTPPLIPDRISYTIPYRRASLEAANKSEQWRSMVVVSYSSRPVSTLITIDKQGWAHSTKMCASYLSRGWWNRIRDEVRWIDRSQYAFMNQCSPSILPSRHKRQWFDTHCGLLSLHFSTLLVYSFDSSLICEYAMWVRQNASVKGKRSDVSANTTSSSSAYCNSASRSSYLTSSGSRLGLGQRTRGTLGGRQC